MKKKPEQAIDILLKSAQILHQHDQPNLAIDLGHKIIEIMQKSSQDLYQRYRNQIVSTIIKKAYFSPKKVQFVEELTQT